MAKQKDWEPFQNIPMYRAEVFGLSVPVSLSECITRLLKMRHSRRDIDVHVGNDNDTNSKLFHIQWGKHTPIHIECFLTVAPSNAREVRLVGKIGVVTGNAISPILTFFVIWAVLAANAFRQNGFSVELIVMLIAVFGVMGLAAFALYTIPVITRPVTKRLDSILSFAFYGKEHVERKWKRLVIKDEEILTTTDAEVIEQHPMPKRSNHVPR